MSGAPTIRRRLALLVLASATPAVLLTAGLLGLEHRRDRETLEHDSIATARAMVHAIDRELVSITAAAQVLATSLRAQAGDLDAFYPQAREVVGRHIGANVVLSEPGGRQILNTLRPPGEALPAHGNPAQLRAVLETGRPVVSDLYTGGVLKRPVMSVDVPVVIEDRIAYVLSIGELPERFSAILSLQKLPKGWIGAVFDRQGAIVARTHEHARFVGARGAEPLVRRMAEQPEGALEITTLEGIPVVSAFSRSEASGWTVAIGIPQDVVRAQLWQRTRMVVIAAIVILALGLALAWSIGGSIADSVRGLVKPAAQIGMREEIRVPPLGLREADEVGEALARASRMIVSAEHRAHHDPLTGLANRVLLREMAAHHVEICRRERKRLSMLFIDLDGFKPVNDTYGHETGDRLLCAVAERLRSAVRGSDVAARIGGDEFAMLLDGADAGNAAAVAVKLAGLLAQPYEVGGRTLHISASIGWATYPESGNTAAELMKLADEAMYRVKAGGRGAAQSAGEAA